VGAHSVLPLPQGGLVLQATLTQRGPAGAGGALLGCSVEELSALAVELGQPAYRGRQLSDCLLQGARSTDDLHTVPAPRGASAPPARRSAAQRQGRIPAPRTAC
jgi:hypothetical protein